DPPDLHIPGPSERPLLSRPPQDEAMRKFRAEQAAGKDRKCIGCGAPMKVGAVICRNCGFNTATGERGGAPHTEWDENADEGQKSTFSKFFGKRDWRPEDRALRTLTIFGVIISLIPLIGLKAPVLVKPGLYISYGGLALGWIAAGLFAKRM